MQSQIQSEATMKKLIAEYVFIDGFNTTRSKTRIINPISAVNDTNTGKLTNNFVVDVWTVDGSSTGQSETNASDIILNPVALFNDPFNVSTGEVKYILVMCEILNIDGTPHVTNTRGKLVELLKNMGDELEMWAPMFGIEQEYVLLDKDGSTPYNWSDEICKMNLKGGISHPQDGKFYCGVGADRSIGRNIAMEHMNRCIASGVMICGINAEVAPAQWEFQVGVCNAIEIGDHLWMARYILGRVAELHDACISYHPKPFGSNWNGSGGHTNFSTKDMREAGGMKYIEKAINQLSQNHNEHMAVYGVDNNMRLTGIHETSDIGTFTYGECNRGSSIRIPANVKAAGCGYFEDRRPAANLDPYLVAWRMIKTVCCSD